MKGYQAGDIIFDGEKGVYPHLWYPQCNKCLVSVYGNDEKEVNQYFNGFMSIIHSLWFVFISYN